MGSARKITMPAAAAARSRRSPLFGTEFYLLPLAIDFPSMAVALAPLVLTCGFIIAQPRIGAFGLLAVVYFAVASNITLSMFDNAMHEDAVGVLNGSLATLLCVGVAVVLFATFFPRAWPTQVGGSAGSCLST